MQSKLLKIKMPIYYAVAFDGDAASVKRHDSLPDTGYVIEISPRDDDGRGNGEYPVRLFVDGNLTSWKTEHFEIIKMSAGYSWTDIAVKFIIRDKRGGEVTLMGDHSRFNLEEGIVSLVQKWAWCRKFHFTDTIQVYRDHETVLSVIKVYDAQKWMSEKLFISFKKDFMKIDECIKSTILSCMECGYTTDIEYLQGIRNGLKQRLWDIQLN